jgi:hypothetical protein
MLPISLGIGSLASLNEFAVKTTRKVICPDGSTSKSHAYETMRVMILAIRNLRQLWSCIV